MSDPVGGKDDEYILGKPHTVKILFLLTLLMVFDFGDRMIIASLLPIIKADWNITDAEAGLLSSVLFLGMVIFLFPASIIIDRWSRLKTASLMGIFWSVASAAGALTKNATELLVTRAGVGVGEAGYAPAAYAWIAAVFPKRRRQLALGVFSAAQPIGMAVGVALGGYIGRRLGWHHALGLMALPGLVVAIFLYWGRDYKNEGKKSYNNSHPVRFERIRQIFTTPSLIFAYFAGAMGTFQWVSIFYFLPTFLNRAHGVPVASASYMVSGLMLLVVVAVPLGGWAMDSWNIRTPDAKLIFTPIVAALGTVVFAVAFVFVDNYVAQYVLIVISFFIGSTAGTTTLSMTQELVPPRSRALSGSCFTITLHLLGSAPGPYLTGLISDHYGLSTALVSVWVASGSLSIIALLLARRYYLRDLERVGSHKLSSL